MWDVSSRCSPYRPWSSLVPSSACLRVARGPRRDVGLFGMLARREQAEEGGFGTPDSQRTGTTNLPRAIVDIVVIRVAATKACTTSSIHPPEAVVQPALAAPCRWGSRHFVRWRGVL